MIMKENIQTKENKLFEKYENILNWVKDGIINEDDFFESKVKVLYVLKEANGGKNKEWKNGDLRNYLSNYATRWQTWNNLVRWQFGIENINNDNSWQTIDKINVNFRKEYLRHVAIINLKKQAGSKSSNMREIFEHAKRDVKLIKSQIELYDPEIVICGGTGDIVKEIGLFEGLDKWEKSARGVSFNIAKNRIIVSYKHPAARQSKKHMFIDIINTIKEAKSNIKELQ